MFAMFCFLFCELELMGDDGTGFMIMHVFELLEE